MQRCDKKHNEIIHTLNECPLCNLMDHNNGVHDFIEAAGIQYELVEFQKTKKLSIRMEGFKSDFKRYGKVKELNI